jgi:hypothetical protein
VDSREEIPVAETKNKNKINNQKSKQGIILLCSTKISSHFAAYLQSESLFLNILELGT